MDKLYAHIIKREDNRFELAGLSEDKILWFILPTEHQDLRKHTILMAKQTIRRAISAIKPVNGYRKVGIKMDEDIKSVYFDEDDNLCFLNIPLEESTTPVSTNLSFDNPEEGNILLKRIKELEIRLNKDEIKLHEIERKFVLDKFEKTQNPAEWLARFSTECTRHNVLDDSKIIEVLRFFVEGPSKDWYENN